MYSRPKGNTSFSDCLGASQGARPCKPNDAMDTMRDGHSGPLQRTKIAVPWLRDPVHAPNNTGLPNMLLPHTRLFNDPGKKKGTLFWEDHFSGAATTTEHRVMPHKAARPLKGHLSKTRGHGKKDALAGSEWNGICLKTSPLLKGTHLKWAL